LLQIGFETQPAVRSGESSSSTYRPTFIAPTIEEMAPHFPQLEILEVLGHGGMGVVYKARQIELDRVVALKILRPNISQDAGFAERFLREARALAKLNHPNIITVYDFGRKDALYFFIMEFVDGTNLRHVERVGQLSPAAALNIVPQICSALQYAHDNGVVHRDIKPENILLTKSGDVRIADFGLAKLAGMDDHAPLTGTWQVMGTPHYMAPEQFEKPNTVDHRADIYSLGVVIYELLTGELPIGRFRLPSEKVHVDVRLDEVVLRALDKEPDRRYQRVTDVATAVDAASAAGPSEPTHIIQNVRQWASATATAAGERINTLQNQAINGEELLRNAVNLLGARSHGIGTILMWVGGINALVSLRQMDSVRRPFSSGMEVPVFFAACLAFWFGRQLRRNAVSKPLRWAGLLCLLPVITDLVLPDLCRVLFMAMGLIASLHEKFSNTSNGAHDFSVADKFAKGLGRVQSVMTPRLLLLTLAGVGGWCIISGLSIGGLSMFWYSHLVPSTYVVADNSAQDVRLMSEGPVKISIVSSETTEWQGMSMEGLKPERHTLELRGESRNGSTFIEFDFETNQARRPLGPEFERSSINRDDVQNWMSLLVDNVNLLQHQKEVDNVYDVVSLMMKTRGLVDRMSLDEGSYPTLQRQLERLLRDPQSRSGLIPVGRLLDPDLFSVSNTNIGVREKIAPKDFAIPLFVSGAIAVFVVGLLRVLRVLYRQLWRPVLFPISDAATNQAVADREWKWCSVAMLMNGLLASAAMIVAFVLVSWINAGRSGGSILEQHAWLAIPMFLSFWVSFSIAVGSLLARPVLRSVGHRIGQLTAIVAILIMPLALITFPAGLSAWILLTSPPGRDLFRSRGESVEVPLTTAN
jgi:predicted Ser/Thr protein kinase